MLWRGSPRACNHTPPRERLDGSDLRQIRHKPWDLYHGLKAEKSLITPKNKPSALRWKASSPWQKSREPRYERNGARCSGDDDGSACPENMVVFQGERH